MSKKIFGLNAFAMIATGCFSHALAQSSRIGSIVGLAVDDRKIPLAGVEIRSGDRAVLTGTDGRFTLDSLESGRRQFAARRLGYSPESLLVNFDPRRSDTLVFVMSASAATLDRLDVVDTRLVSPRLEGFEQRLARKNGGQFVTRSDIERRMPQVTSDIIRRLQGVRIVDSMGVQLPVSTRGPKPTLLAGSRPGALCVLRVGVDGIMKESYFAMNTISVSDIHGVEVYSGPATIPPEFNNARRDAMCGLIMIWTRAR
jgi:hypothetical protein